MKHILTTALLSAVAAGTMMAQSIVGSWQLNEPGSISVVTFLSNGTYFMAQDGRNNDPAGKDGMERGTYKWNAFTGALSTRTTVDTNKQWGLSHAKIRKAVVTGNKLNATASDGRFTLTRVAASSKIVGGWYFKNPDGYGVVNFLANGTYLMAEDGDNNDDSGKDGMERGSYTWNASTKRFTSKTTVDTNKQWGLSHTKFSSISIAGNKLTAIAGRERIVLTKVAATLIKKTPEIAIDQPVGKPLVDGKSTRNLGAAKVGRAAKPKTFTIINRGKASLKLSKIRRVGKHAADFRVGKPSRASLAPGQKATLRVTFKPRATGKRNAALRIYNNDSNENPFDIKLIGTGR